MKSHKNPPESPVSIASFDSNSSLATSSPSSSLKDSGSSSMQSMDEKSSDSQSPSSIAEEKLKDLKKLEGRGQSLWFAAFCKLLGEAGSVNRVVLIKEDNAATCLMEGSVGYVRTLMPEKYLNVVNFAESGTLLTKEGKEKPISIQDKVKLTAEEAVAGLSVDGFDNVVLGHKRNPKGVLADPDIANKEKIHSCIAKMGNDVKWQFATALFASYAVHDESLHIGQFMVVRNDANEISRIIRVDLGARSRYLSHRVETEDFNHTTSIDYATSRLLGEKDYLSNYLTDIDLRSKYLHLWARTDLPKAEKVAEAAVRDFFIALNRLPKSDRSAALDGAYKELNKNSKIKDTELDIFKSLSLGDKINKMEALLIMMEMKSFTLSQQAAQKKIEKGIEKYCEILNFDKNKKDDILNFLAGNFERNSDECLVNKLFENFKINNFDISNIQAARTILCHIKNNLESKLFSNPDLNNNFDLRAEILAAKKIEIKFDVVENLLNYLNHLQAKTIKDSLDGVKIEAINNVLTKLADKNEDSLDKVIDDTFLRQIAKRSNPYSDRLFSSAKSSGEELSDQLSVLLKSNIEIKNTLEEESKNVSSSGSWLSINAGNN